MNSITRNGKRWTVNECIQLQREFELLQLSVSEIAFRHKRTPNAIIFKLDHEGLANYNVLYSNHHDLNTTIPTQRTNKYDDGHEEQEYTSKNNKHDDDLNAHIMRLEKQVMALTEMFLKSNKNKSEFSLFV